MEAADNIAELVRLLDHTDDRASISARLRPALPHIQERVTAGTPYTAILDDLQAAGFTVKRRLLERVLYRWRKAQRENPAPREVLIEDPPSFTLPTASIPSSSLDHGARRIETPKDLRRIRDMRIDLEALRQEGIAKRKGK